MQKLTDRQCWDVIRALVAEKNKEYASFIARNFEDRELTLAVGFTKNTYLNKFGLKSEAELRYLIKRRGIMPKDEWLDNLSVEDLVLFLDYRCRSLQSIYNYFKQVGVIGLTDVNDALIMAKPSSLINYNYQRLLATGRPEKTEGEQSIRKLNAEVKELKHQALTQALAKVAYKYSRNMEADIDKAIGKALALQTTNTDLKGNITGHDYKGTNNEILYYIQDNLVEHHKEQTKDSNLSFRMIGYNKNKEPVFIYKDGSVVNMLGKPMQFPDVVYDVYGQKIEEQQNNIPDFSKGKYLGVDYQGTPIYEIDGEYYRATGERLEEPLIDKSYEFDSDEYGL